jgi:hypothetical protein
MCTNSMIKSYQQRSGFAPQSHKFPQDATLGNWNSLILVVRQDSNPRPRQKSPQNSRKTLAIFHAYVGGEGGARGFDLDVASRNMPTAKA